MRGPGEIGARLPWRCVNEQTSGYKRVLGEVDNLLNCMTGLTSIFLSVFVFVLLFFLFAFARLDPFCLCLSPFRFVLSDLSLS